MVVSKSQSGSTGSGMFPSSDSDTARRILVADPDPGFRDGMVGYLGARGYSLHPAADAAGLEAILACETIDLILLDVALPGEDGLSICRRLSTEGGPPILLLNEASAEMDRVIGLEMGADLYLEKSSSPRELLAHIRALLRRVEHIRISPPGEGRAFHFRGFVLDPGRHALFAPGGDPVRLTEGEYALLKMFAEHPQQVLSRQVLHNASRPGEPDSQDRAVDVQVGRLRKRLDAFDTDLIQTARGAGYLFKAPVKIYGSGLQSQRP